MTPISDEDFSAVAWFILMMPEADRPAVFVHSDNTYALETIQSILPEAKRLTDADLQ